MRLFTQTALDFIFPPREEELRIRTLTTDEVLTLHTPQYRGEITSLLPFTHPIVQALIHEAKFWHNTHAQTILADVLATYIATTIDAPFILTSIPLSEQRLRERGYNQVSEIIKKQPALTHQTILKRTRNTVPQTSLDRSKRQANMHEAFACITTAMIQDMHPDTHIIIVDDVTTTGATLIAAKTTLQQHTKHRISCVALAH